MSPLPGPATRISVTSRSSADAASGVAVHSASSLCRRLRDRAGSASTRSVKLRPNVAAWPAPPVRTASSRPTMPTAVRPVAVSRLSTSVYRSSSSSAPSGRSDHVPSAADTMSRAAR